MSHERKNIISHEKKLKITKNNTFNNFKIIKKRFLIHYSRYNVITRKYERELNGFANIHQ